MLDYFNSLTPPQTVLFFAATLAAILLLHILRCVIWRNGICPVPQPLLFGFWGVSVAPWLMLVATDYKNHAALIAHERCHQDQQRRDGLLTFWFRYLTNKQARQDYEVEAYRVWYQTEPKELRNCVWALTKSYGFKLTEKEAINLLTK
jgi:hypothetical protein